MAGYTRQSLADIQDGEDIVAGPLNDEFDALQSAFNGTTGHSHDGTTGNSPKIELTAAASVNGILPLANGGTGQATTTAFAQTLLDDANAAAALTTLGISSYAQTLLDDANAGAALTTLGVSAFAQTLLDDAAASNARTTLGLGTSATVDTGTSGATIPLLNGANTWSNDQIITNTSPTLTMTDTDTTAATVFNASSTAGSFAINVDSTSVGSAPLFNMQVRGSTKISLSPTTATLTVPTTFNEGIEVAVDEDITFGDGFGGVAFGTTGRIWYDSSGPEFIFEEGGVSNGAIAAGSVYLTGLAEVDQIQINSTTDASLASTGHGLQIGPTNATNLIMDVNEIICRNNGATSTLVLQTEGGNITLGNSTTVVTVSNDVSIVDAAYTSGFAGTLPSFASSTTAGFFLDASGLQSFSRSANLALQLQRTSSDGTIQAFYRQGTVVGTISVTGSATAYNTSSDVRLKQDFQPINPKLLDLINVYDFEWKADGTRAYGVKAQELEEIVPQAVHKGDSEDDMWSVDYSKLVPIMIAKIQELEARLKVLEGN